MTGLVKSSRVLLPLLADQRHQRLPTELVNTRTEVSQLLHSSSLLRSEDFSVKKEQFLSQFTPIGELDANRVKKEP